MLEPPRSIPIPTSTTASTNPTPRCINILRQLIPQHRKLIRPQSQPPLLERIQRRLHAAFGPREDCIECGTDDEDGDGGPEVPDCGPGDGGHAEEGGEVGDGEEEGCDGGEEGGVVGLDGVGDVEFEFDEVVEACDDIFVSMYALV